MSVCQQSCPPKTRCLCTDTAGVGLWSTGTALFCWMEVHPTKVRKGSWAVRWSNTSEISTATQGKILTLWSPKQHLLQCLHLFLFPFVSVMSSEARCSSTGLASWTSWALLWILSSLGAQCPALGDDLQRGDTRKAPTSPRVMQEGDPLWATRCSWQAWPLLLLLPLVSCTATGCQAQGGFFGVRWDSGLWERRRMIPYQLSHPPPPLWWKVGSVLFLFLLLSPLPKKSLWLTLHHTCSTVFLGSGPPHENKNNPSCFSSQLSRNIRKCSRRPGMYFNSDYY